MFVHNLKLKIITVVSSLPRKQSSKNREMLDYDLLEELMNRTFSDSDDLDSTFTISRNDEASMNVSWNEEGFLDDSQSKNKAHISLKDTLPTSSASDRHKLNLSSTEISFESTVGDIDELAFMMTRKASTSSLNEESRTRFENNGKLSIGSTVQPKRSNLNGSFKSDESSDAALDAADAMISKLVQMQKDGTTNFKINAQFQQGNRKNSKNNSEVKLKGVKKRKNIVKHIVEVGNREHPINETKSQESVKNEIKQSK